MMKAAATKIGDWSRLWECHLTILLPPSIIVVCGGLAKPSCDDVMTNQSTGPCTPHVPNSYGKKKAKSNHVGKKQGQGGSFAPIQFALIEDCRWKVASGEFFLVAYRNSLIISVFKTVKVGAPSEKSRYPLSDGDKYLSSPTYHYYQ